MDDKTVKATRSWRQGTLIQTFIFSCECCAKDNYSFAATRQQAMADARSDGWGTYKGSWYCPTCVKEIPK